MKYDIIDILKKDFERLSPSELAECGELFSTKEEFLALKESMLMIKSEHMKDEITPDNKLKSSLMDEFNQKWQEKSTPWYERLIAFILGPSKPLFARPWFVATGIATVALLVFITLPLNDNQPQMAEVFESKKDEIEVREELNEETTNKEKMELSSISELREDNQEAAGDVLAREQFSPEEKEKAAEERDVKFFSFAEKKEASEINSQEVVSTPSSISRNNKDDDYRVHQSKAKTLDETEAVSKTNSGVTGNADKKSLVDFKHSDWLETDAEEERKTTLSKAKTDLLWDLLEPAF